ncbi:hypothetical protein L249_8193 [Ophiocordyceps polyrhachis-furcata BCC 54312]|uniref:CNH domain-containing protein n=1 Tax=Ophiocordyceps polyrhachis-furcata BCC 54312 TaxID=1330021 RepID=A0A367LHZ9_9HYPO|nr:hypothetical protein L249_8193 [Ophiocordyceps polyrhachis-furcata BCC 54312]
MPTSRASFSRHTARTRREDGPYVLRPLLDDVPLSADGSQGHVEIKCIEYLGRTPITHFELNKLLTLYTQPLGGNLYVGTSASELLHFVQIPPDPSDESRTPIFILASRLSPAFSDPSGASESSRPGVQKILLLPSVGKACVLCNWTVTFYSLPELSPVSGTGQVKNCNWIGGVDLNKTTPRGADVTILLSLKRRIQVVRVGENARAFKVGSPHLRRRDLGLICLQNIDYAGSTLSVRRDSIACVADSKSYALLDVERQLKIPLMSISSLDEPPLPGEVGQAQSIASDAAGGIIRSASSAENRPQSAAQSHNRSASLGGSILGNIRRQEPRRSESEGSTLSQPSAPNPPSSPQLPPAAPVEPGSAAPSADKPLPAAPAPEAPTSSPAVEQQASQKAVRLKPLIASLTADEFLVVIGTSPSEPGIGMFVNLEGDATRATIGFEQYPVQIAVDGSQADMPSSLPDEPGIGMFVNLEGDATRATIGFEQYPVQIAVDGSQADMPSSLPDEVDGYVLASMARKSEDQPQYGLEIQRWGGGNESNPEKHWLAAEGPADDTVYGIGALSGQGEIQFDAIVAKLCNRRFSAFPGPIEASTPSVRSSDSRTASSIERLSKERELFERDDSQDDDCVPDGWEATRAAEERDFAGRLAKTEVRLAVWAGDRIWWAVRNPLLLRHDTALDMACSAGFAEAHEVDKGVIFSVLDMIRGRDAKTELQFLTFCYLRQKTGLLLLIRLLTSTESLSDSEVEMLEAVLIESKLDPRVVLALVPGLRNEIIEGRRGIWIYGGVRQVADAFLRGSSFESIAKVGLNGLGSSVLHFLRRFLWSWRRMKGFGSVADEKQVFRTVDAALLTVLLQLDQDSPKWLGKGGAVRSELNDVVDKGVECFDRAVDLLESHRRLFTLSRLYQSRKMVGDVLATWKRIIEGQRDDGQELRDGEQRVRDYLAKVSNPALVREYGVWLANRNPLLGVQVFAEERVKGPKFEPAAVVSLLREEAPAAVRHYLEHLVFGLGKDSYVNDLISYYLDLILGELQSSAASREAVMTAYSAYRALRPPKPTYQHFLAENASDDDATSQSRLRLLQLLGGPYDVDAPSIRSRLASLDGDLLVPETIMLAGRQGLHHDALRLLVHTLGDYDTAVAYCLRGGTSVYVSSPPPPPPPPPSSVKQQQQQQQQQQGTKANRRHLFATVLREFLAIDDVSDRVEQTGNLLEQFGRWFDVDDVLPLIPPTWPVRLIAGFLVGAFKRLVREKHESCMARALSGAENLSVSYRVVAAVDGKGPVIEAKN